MSASVTLGLWMIYLWNALSILCFAKLDERYDENGFSIFHKNSSYSMNLSLMINAVSYTRQDRRKKKNL